MTSLEELSVDAARILVQATTVDIFNEQDLSKRRQLMEKHWAADLTCCSVMGAYTGYDALDRLWDGEYHLFFCISRLFDCMTKESDSWAFAMFYLLDKHSCIELT